MNTIKITLVFLMLLLNNITYGQKIYFSGSPSITISIALVDTIYPGSIELREVPLNVNIINNSKRNIDILPLFYHAPSFADSNFLSVNEAHYLYSIEKYNYKSKSWQIEGYNFRDLDRVAPPENSFFKVIYPEDTVQWRTIRPDESTIVPIMLFNEVKFKQSGRYRIKIIFGVKVSETLFAKFESNSIEFIWTGEHKNGVINR